MTSRLVRTLVGHAEAVSPAFSPQWRLVQGDNELAVMRRYPRRHISKVKLADNTEWQLEPAGWGVVRATESGVPFATITRRSWIGRRWEVTGVGFSAELVSRRAPRRWAFEIGNSPIADLAGSMLSYNHLRIDAHIAIPLSAVLLAWHVIVRPWEAASHPTELIARPASRPQTDHAVRPETA